MSLERDVSIGMLMLREGFFEVMDDGRNSFDKIRLAAKVHGAHIHEVLEHQSRVNRNVALAVVRCSLLTSHHSPNSGYNLFQPFRRKRPQQVVCTARLQELAELFSVI